MDWGEMEKIPKERNSKDQDKESNGTESDPPECFVWNAKDFQER